MDRDPVPVDRPVGGHVEPPGAVGVGGEDLDLVAGRGLRARQAVHRTDRPAVAPGGQVGRNDVEDSHRARRRHGRPARGALAGFRGLALGQGHAREGEDRAGDQPEHDEHERVAEDLVGGQEDGGVGRAGMRSGRRAGTRGAVARAGASRAMRTTTRPRAIGQPDNRQQPRQPELGQDLARLRPRRRRRRPPCRRRNTASPGRRFRPRQPSRPLRRHDRAEHADRHQLEPLAGRPRTP